MLRSASSARAAEIGRARIEAHHLKTVAGALKGPHAAERAGLLLAVIAGFQAMRQMIGLTPLAEAAPGDLAGLLAPLFAQIIAAPAGTGWRRARRA